MFHRKQNQAATAVPASAGGTANYPAVASQGVGYGDQAGRDVNVKLGYGYDQNGNNVMPQQTAGYGGVGHVQQQTPGYSGAGHVQQQNAGYDGGYVQQTPVSYGPNGQPLHTKKKNNRSANRCAAAFIACWACTWPCHGPCCCGL